MEMKRLAVIASLLLVGCASGPFYWTRSNATPESFLADHAPCFKTATVGYGVGSEKAYKACMLSKGWTRIQGRGGEFPDVPYFRGPEGDDEFTVTEEPCDRWQAGLDRHRVPPSGCVR
jgi:hypothetical protein